MMSKFKSVYSNFDIDDIDGGPPKLHPTLPPQLKLKTGVK